MQEQQVEEFGGLARPAVSLEQAQGLAESLFGVRGRVSELGSQQDRNFLIEAERGRFLLKVSNPAFPARELEAQDVAMRALHAADIPAPEPVMPLAGGTAAVDVDGRTCVVRLLTFVDGEPLIDVVHWSTATTAALGDLAGRVSAALADAGHPGFERRLQWDLRHAERVVGDLLRHVADDDRRRLVEDATAQAAAALAPLADRLPLQVLHGDLTDDNTVCERDALGRPRLTGVIDLGDAALGWRVAELAIACSPVFHHDPDRPLAVLPLIAAFDAHARLTDDEIAAIWPLLVLRGATLVVSGEQQVAIDPGNDYADTARDREWLMFAVPAAFDEAVATAAIRRALGRHVAAPRSLEAGPVVPVGTAVAVVDLGWSSRQLEAGDWLHDPEGTEERVLGEAAASGIAATRFGQPRLTRARALDPAPPRNAPLGVDLRVATPTGLVAPFDGELRPTRNGLVLTGRDAALVVDGVGPESPGPVSAGAPIGTVRRAAWLQLLDLAVGPVPAEPRRFVPAAELPAWRVRFLDPAPLLGMPPAPAEEPPAGVLARRDAAYSTLQSHYYAAPPRIERGWRELLIDTDGRHHLDMVNNVTVLGHGHPRIAAAAADQWRMLNTNSRFHYGVVADLSERLLATLPGSFDTVLLVNSGSEAVDLALRLARAFTGRDDVLCVQESYHGWTLASDAVSTALSDNPRAEETRPGWVHVVDALNAYRGRHRGPDAGAAYAADAVAEIDRLAAAGTPLAAFLAEPRNGNAGAIEVPPGYLAAVSTAVRAHGGVWIDDEVQVGYGRQGDVFWGYQQHEDVVPDIVTVAKAMGDGHPLGAVITRREIADALASQGSFFSSAGGSTLSARIGLEVLAVLQDEGLQANAHEVGEHLRRRLEALAERQPLIGAVHGRGLYLGVELVRDRVTLEPATEETAALCDRMLELGVIVQPTGDRQNVLKVKPPLCFTLGSADHFVDLLDRVLTEGF
ncbi:aminotransferase [Amnibacterium sp. CER49]|uniref:aminotransferase n=1 Tax=Amnibacterium sp. CER49 TaxID=3039161 RepID=UPI0024488C12|nr:aminotransferase [Amnibacterium sp. CER49]MDH2445179.1 aminotransferase [Amnibacterium sp. CER49]